MWVLFALAASVLNAFYYLSIQNAKINANVFMVYRGFMIVLFLLPILVFFPVRFSPNFYLMSVLQGCIVAYTDYLSFRVNKNYGSETVSSITPLSVIIVFVAWCFINPATFMKYLDHPIKSLCIVASLLGVVWALLNYRKTPLTKKAFLLLIPVLILSSTISILNKLIMSYSGENPLLCACWRVLILSSIIGVVHLYIYTKKKLPVRALFELKNLQKGCVLVLLLVVLVLKSLAMLYAFNPAYVSCIVYLTAVWIMVLSYRFDALKFKRQHRQSSKKYEIVFIISVIALILLTH